MHRSLTLPTPTPPPIFAVSIACMSAHYAADKHGKSGLARRNQDASRTLRDLSLTFDDEEVDTHLAHDVSILLGDLVRFRGRSWTGFVCMNA